ncbi:MAG: M48 family metalloprotease, partial [Ketobacteraceae bacterium]|nr:M48 family metalloprotease [Ketobacteraceae bacterium]
MTMPDSLPIRWMLAVAVVVLTACAPRPDPDNKAEMARVFGECSFRLNTAILDLPVIPDDDPRVTVINNIVSELVNSRYQQFPWTIRTTLLEHPLPNAFTTGGGFLAAFSGVYAMAENEAALAGIIAHELAHMEKLDPMELAEYLEVMLASRLGDDAQADYDKGQALQTVVDFCLAIPGLVSRQWPRDLNQTVNNNISPEYG